MKKLKKIIHPLKIFISKIIHKVKKSIRLELILAFALSIIIAFICGEISSNSFSKPEYIDYSYDVLDISQETYSMSESMEQNKISINDTSSMKNYLENMDSKKYNLIVADEAGKVIYRINSSSDRVNINDSIRSSLETSRLMMNNYNMRESREYTFMYPVKFSDGNGYLIVSAVPNGRVMYNYNDKNELLPVILSVLVFILSFYFITSRKMKYIETISLGLGEISKGNLGYRIKKVGEDELSSLADNINNMSINLAKKIQGERELITNVSHDLRTPLTSIKGYLGLIKDKNFKNEDQLFEYVSISYKKSEKLELLINDLFEYSKLSFSGIKLAKKEIDLGELLSQLTEELVPICEQNNVKIEKELPKEKISINVDPVKIARVFENLLINAIRYSLKPGSIKLKLLSAEGHTEVMVSNLCEEISEEDVKRLFERFYRTDKSRSSEMGGSGLGLAIAKSIVELHGGTIEAKYNKPEICFKIIL